MKTAWRFQVHGCGGYLTAFRASIPWCLSAVTTEETVHLIHSLSTASKLTFGKARDYTTAALAIQKNYRGWKSRRDFVSVCQKVVKIQAHVRGYLAKNKIMVCWAVGVLEKAILRWHRRGVGLRGFRLDLGSVDKDDEDILKVFRKLKVDAAIDEAVSRVLSMVESPTARQQYRRPLEKYRQAKLANGGEGRL